MNKTSWKYDCNHIPFEDHLGSVGDSTKSGSPPAIQTRLFISLQNHCFYQWGMRLTVKIIARQLIMKALA